MENRYIITETGKLLTQEVRRILEQEFDIPRERVGMGMPGEDGRLSLCIFMYDIRKNLDMHTEQYKAVGREQLRYPSNYYDIFYMLVPYAAGDVRYQMEEIARIIDILLKHLGDVSYLEVERQPLQEQSDAPSTDRVVSPSRSDAPSTDRVVSPSRSDAPSTDRVAFQFDNPDFDEKVKIWNSINQPLCPSLFCRVGPVEVESGRTRGIKRVEEVNLQVEEKN